MGGDLTVALFDGRELRGFGPARFMCEARPDVVAGSHEQLRQARAVATELRIAFGEVAAPAALHCSAPPELAHA